MAISQEMQKLIDQKKAQRVQEIQKEELVEGKTPQYWRAKKAFEDFFGELNFQDGRLLYLQIGQRVGFQSKVDGLLSRLDYSQEMTSEERLEIRQWVSTSLAQSWKYFREIRERKAEVRQSLVGLRSGDQLALNF